jgi:hypothetical protein
LCNSSLQFQKMDFFDLFKITVSLYHIAFPANRSCGKPKKAPI